MFLEEVADNLKQHAAQFDLENRAIQACKEHVEILLVDSPDETRFHLRGLSTDELVFRFIKHELVFGSWRSWPHILSRVVFGPPNKNCVLEVEPWGYYDLETVEDGEMNDDWFWWEQMRDEDGKLIEFSSVSE